ncbi:MAG: hypothetical protein R2728_15360 [Chitinophagales bacterium]
MIAGDINTKETMQLVHKYFDEIKGNNQPITRPAYNSSNGRKRDVVYDNIQLPRYYSYHIPPMEQMIIMH